MSDDRADAILSEVYCDGKSLAEAGMDVQEIKKLVRAGKRVLNEACLWVDANKANEKLGKITTLTAKEKAAITEAILTGRDDRTAAMLEAMTCDGKALSEANVDVRKMVEMIKLGQPALNDPYLSIDARKANARNREIDQRDRYEAIRRQYEAERRELDGDRYGQGSSPARERIMLKYLGFSRAARIGKP